jgi:hypothetical protein
MTTNTIKYADVQTEDFTINSLPWQTLGLQETASGYGSKLTTRWMVRLGGRLRRIYAICYSNVASYYIISKGERLFIRDSAFPETR